MGKVICPRCESDRVVWLAKARVWKCYSKHDHAKFSLKTGTIFEDSALGLDKWLAAVWLIVNCKNGISSYEIARHLGVTQKSAWFMGHRIRLALHAGSFDKLTGEVEVDETFIGGKARNMHVAQRRRRITGTGGKDQDCRHGRAGAWREGSYDCHREPEEKDAARGSQKERGSWSCALQ